MASLVVFKLGRGDWQQGCLEVTVQLWQVEQPVEGKTEQPVEQRQTEQAMTSQWIGSLPAAPELMNCYEQWRSLYLAIAQRSIHSQMRKAAIEVEVDGITNVSQANLDTLCSQLQQQFNHWLETPSFGRIERQLRTKLLPSQAIQVIIEAEDPLLRRFPWQLWNFLEDYPLAEVALSLPEYAQVNREVNLLQSLSSSVRILVVLGDSQGIDVQQDQVLFQQLPQTETVVLVEPDRTELNYWLWDEQGWDILFFAGHSTSQSDGSSGTIGLNPTDQLTLTQLNHALRTAIARRIKLAIFNSCDGIGLARALADLNLPQLIVMREPVPDRIAQEFLKHFLLAFTQGQSLYTAVREAREKLQGWEHQFPCASWLPVICQNPVEAPLTWQSLIPEKLGAPVQSNPELTAPIQGHETPYPNSIPPVHPLHHRYKIAGLTSLVVTSLLMAARFAGSLQGWELAMFDHFLRLRPPESIDPRILVVEVTQQDLEQYGYPLEDATLVKLITTLQTAQPSAIGLDMHRAKSRGQGRRTLIEQFQQHSNLFVVCSFGAADQNAPPPEFSVEQQVAQVGFSDLIVEGVRLNSTFRTDLLSQSDGELGNQVRRQLLSYDPTFAATPSTCNTPYSFSLQLAMHFLSQTQPSQTQPHPITVNADQNWQLGKVVFQKLPAHFAGYQQLDGSSQILINYRTAPPGARATLDQILQGQIDRALIKDRVVLVGTTAPAAKDYFDTPYGEMPGVWIHAHMLSQMLSAVLDDRPLIWALPQWQNWQWGDWCWVLGWSAAGGVLAVRLRSRLWLGIANGAISVALHQLCLVIFIQAGWMPFIPSLLGFWITSLVTRGFITSEVRRQRS